MQDRALKLVKDVADAASFILEQTEDATFESYESNRLLRHAVERNFEIIGEAVDHLRKVDPATAALITDADRIVAFRNVLSHGYSLIDNTHVWKVIIHALPKLLTEVQNLIDR